MTPGYLLAFETFPVTDDVMNGVEPRPSYVCVWANSLIYRLCALTQWLEEIELYRESKNRESLVSAY